MKRKPQARTAVGLSSAGVFILLLLTASGHVGADDPPASQPTTSQAASRPARARAISREKLEEMRRAALKSIGKNGAASQPADTRKVKPAATKTPEDRAADEKLQKILAAKRDAAASQPTTRPRFGGDSARPVPQNIGPQSRRDHPGIPPARQPTADQGDAGAASGGRKLPPAGSSPLNPAQPDPRSMPQHAPPRPETAGPTPPEAASSETETAPEEDSEAVRTLIFTVTPADPESRSYRFDYHDTPWSDVLADFARMSGLSWLNQPEPPAENLSFRSTGPMTFAEALHQLNDLLVKRELNKYLIRRQGDYLVIKRLVDWQRDIPPGMMFDSFAEMEAAELSEFDITMVNWDVPAGWSPYQIIDRFRPLFSDTYGTEVNGDRITLTGLVLEHYRWRDVISKLIDIMPEPPQDDPRPMRVIELKSARAAEVQTMLRQIYPVTAPTARPGPGVDPKMETAKRVDIIADVKNNWIILKAPPDQLKEIEGMIARIDTGGGPQMPEMRVVKLKYADANALVGTLKPVFMKETQALARPDGSWVSRERRAALERDIFADASSNSVILMGGSEGVKSAVEVVQQWDRPGEDHVDQIVMLEHADANDVAAILTQIFPPAAKPGQPADRIVPRTNSSLLVSASKRVFDQVVELVQKLDTPAQDEEKEHLVQPEALKPSALASTLQQAWGAQPQQPRRAGGKRPQAIQAAAPGGPRFVPDDDTGYLIVYCSDEEWTEVEPLIRTLDSQAKTFQPVLKVIALQKAKAPDVVSTLQQMFPPAPPTPGQQPGAAAAQSFFADTFNNTVQIFASEEFIARVTPFIEQLDINTTTELKVIRLEYADAETIAPILTEAVGGSGGGPAAAAQAAARAKAAQAGQVMTIGGASNEMVRIVAEPITNSLLVTAPPKEFHQITELVAEMENEAKNLRPQRVILMAEHRPAEELAETLRALAGGPAIPVAKAAKRRGRGQPQAPGAPAAPDEALTIVPHGRQVIIEGPAEEVAKAIQLFDQIDVPYDRPMFRKYAVEDAEEDAKKLRAMLAKSPIVTEAAPAAGKGKPAATVEGAASAGDVQIYADTYDNTILVAAKREADFLEVEAILSTIFAEARAVREGPKPGESSSLDLFLIDLKYKEAFDIAFDVEKILNPDNKTGGIRLDEGPTKRTLLVRNCKPAERDKVKELVAIFDVPDSMIRSKNVRIYEAEKMPPGMLVRYLQQQTNVSFNVVPLADTTGQVQIIDIHEGEEAPVEEPATQAADESQVHAAKAAAPPKTVNPCVLPASLLVSLAALSPMQTARSNEPAELLEPSVCPVCHQSPCILPAELLKGLDAVAMAGVDDGPDDGDQKEKRLELPAHRPEHNHPIDEPAASTPGTDAASGQPNQGVTIAYDDLTGKIILRGPEELIEDLESILSDIDSDQPVVYRVFPLKYAPVETAAQLLEQVFNTGQTMEARGRARGRPLPIPVPQPPQPQQQQGKPGQPQQQQQPRQPVAVQQGPTRIKVVPDPRTKSLFVAAPLGDIPLVIEVLKKIDARVQPGEQGIKYFPLVNLNAEEVVETLQEVLGLNQGPQLPGPRGRGGRGGQPNQQQQQQIQLQNQQGGVSALVSAEEVSLSAEPQTNTIIAKAPPDTMAVIENIIEDLDQKMPNTMKPVMQRVALANAQASSVATIVKDVVSNITGRGGRREGRGAISGRVSVNADPRTNSVILGGQQKDVEVVVGIVREMDIAETNGSRIEQFTVKGDAAAMANTLKTMFASGQQTDIVITGDTGTGTILVKAPPPQMEEIEKQIVMMDAKVADTKSIKSIKLLVADPEQIAPKLQEIFTGTRGSRGAKQEVNIKGAKTNNTLYVTGADDETFEAIQAIAADLDAQPTGIQVQRFPLEHASAVEIEKQLTDMMVKAKATGGLEGIKLDLVGVVADPRTNSLIVTGGPITFLLIEDVLGAVDLPPPEGIARTTVTYQLPLAVDVNQVTQNILALFATETARKTGLEPPTATANVNGNMVMVTATAAQHAEIKASIIDPIMSAVGSAFEDYRVDLKFIRAEDARATLEDFMNKWKISRGNKPQDTCVITADPNSNMLLVNCSPETKKVLDAQLASMDTEHGQRETRPYQLAHARAQEVATAMTQAFQAKTVQDSKGKWPITITPDAASNQVIVTAMSDLWPEVEAMVGSLDVPTADPELRSQRVIEVVNSNPQDVASAVQQILDAQVRGMPNRQSAQVRAITGANKLLVLANDAEYQEIQELVNQVDIEGGSGVFTVTMPDEVPAKTVADAITQLYGQGTSGIKAQAHEPTNTVLVSATEAEFKKIKEHVIDRLSETPPIGVLSIHRIKLQYAVADEVAKTLQDFFDKKSGAKRQAGLPPWMRSPQAQQLEDQVSIVAEPNSNMLLLYCTDATKRLVDDLIAEIDVDLRDKSVMEMVTLEYADANDVLEILTEYLRVSTRTKEDEDAQWRPWWMERQDTPEEKVILAGDMRLKAIESMNAIVVVGKREGVDEAVAKIKELDKERTDGGDVPQTIRLVNTTASDLADKLTRVFNDPALVKSKGGSYVPPIIVAEDATNSLIVRAKTSDFNMIKKMAENLDAQMEGETTGGVRVLSVPTGRDLEELARNVEKRINDAEQNRQKLQKEYKPSLVSIGADLQASALLVAGSKGKYEEVKAIVDELVSMAPSGGRERRVIKLKTLTGDEVRELIEQIQDGNSGSTRTRSRGPRSDATWTRRRRYERPLRAVAPAASLPVLMMQITLGAAVAQTTSQAAQPRRDQPVISTIRPRTPTTRPARSSLSPEALIKSAARQGRLAGEKMTEAARAAFGRKLSGAPITIAEAGADSVVIDATEEDMEVIISILELLDEAIPGKEIEYVALEKASAQDLAKTLTDVFSKIEQKGQRQVRPEDKVDIIADPRTNGLYIAATDEKMQQALELIKQNEEAAGHVLQQMETYTFKNRRVTEVGEVLKKMVSAYLNQKGLDAKVIQVEVDPTTNSVFITANQTDLEFVSKIIQGLDAELPPPAEGESPMGEADVMIIPLRVAEADALGTLLNELLQKAATGDTPMKDFIRRFRLLDETGEPLATVNLDRPIVIFGEKDSNSLIIASTRKNCLIMKQVALAFDKEPARAEVAYRVFSLTNADATEIAEQINKLLTDGANLTKRPGKGDASGVPDGDAGSLVFSAVATADARTNQLLIVARPAAMEVLADLVGRLDVKGLDVLPFTLVHLEYASVSALETALSELMKERAEALPKGTGPNAGKSETVIIKGDPRSQSLIIAAKPNRLEELRGIIRQLDVPSTALVEDIRTITLTNTNAADLAEKLKSLWEQRAAQQEGGGDGFKLEVPAIVADERSNSLIVAAAKGDFEAIRGVVEKIEALELNPMSNIYIVRLKYNSAQQLQGAFQALFDKRAEMRTVDGKSRPEDQVAIEVDETTNALLFVGSRENYDVLMQKVQELDQEIGVPGVVEFFTCDNVGAHRVKETIDELFGEDGVYKPGVTGESDAAKARNKVTVTVDDRANMLIVSAAPENMELVREIYERMNSVATPWDVAITRLIVIEHGDAVKIAAQVADYFDKLDEVRKESKGEGAAAGGFGITVFADERSNRIVIGGTKDGIDSAVELVQRLDVPPGTPTQLAEVYKLKEAPATRIGEMIQAIFEERNKPRQAGEGAGVQVPNVTVTVEPEVSTNSLLINASREDHVLIADLIQRLDRPSTLMDMVRVIALERAPAERVKEILEELYQSGAGGEGREGRTIGVVEDKRTNSVVVTAAPGELDNIESLVKRIDETEVKGQAEIGVFLCENEDAEKMSELLNELMTGQAREGGGGVTAAEGEEKRSIESMLISFATEDEAGRELFLKTIRENVQITFNTRTNSIVAVAPPSTLRLIEQLVRKLDQIQKRSVMVKVFMLTNADATRMIDILNEMFALEEGDEAQAEFQRGRSIEVEGGSTATGGAPVAESQAGPERRGTFGRPKTTFVADERTNSLIVAGWPEDIDVVADVIDQLDSRPIQDRDNFVFTLVNQDAETIQQALDTYFQEEVARLDALGDTVSPQRRMEQEVSVIAHPESNQLIVSASPRFRPQVISLIEQLDMAPPQVMIQVMIAEVTLDDRFEMGLEFALQELKFSETAVPGGNGVLQSSHFDVVGGTDLGAAGTGLGGFSFTITGEDFNFLVRALQSDSRLEVIQRPMIMCQDNQQATIQIGQSVPTPSGSQTFGGQTSTQVQYQDVGVILNVEPHINPDGFVYLLVEPEVSSVTDSTIQIAPGAFAPIFNRRQASTNVAVMDGETVVIGGLITTTENESESKVPLIGDVPGLGMLFRTTTRTKNRTELLIALTPKIVRTVEDGRRLSEQLRDESGIITDNMKQSVLFGKLRVQPEDAAEIESIETPPAPTDLTLPPTSAPGGEPAVVPTEEQEPEYGPKPQPYGPLFPPGEDAVVRRDGGAADRGYVK